jgi:hypothetical protein
MREHISHGMRIGQQLRRREREELFALAHLRGVLRRHQENVRDRRACGVISHPVPGVHVP